MQTSTVHGTYSCHVTGDLDECEGRYRKRSSLRGMKQERIFCLKAEMCVRNVGVFWTWFKGQGCPSVSQGR